MEFRVGDVVEIRSWGPDMVVTELREKGTQSFVVCTWWSGESPDCGCYCEYEFPPEVLSLVAEAEPAAECDCGCVYGGCQ